MSMTQLIIAPPSASSSPKVCSHGIRHFIGWLQRSDARKRILKPTLR